MIVTYERFRESIGALPNTIDYNTFVGLMKVRRNQKIMPYTTDEFFKERNDDRWDLRHKFYENMYRICVTERERTIYEWYKAHIEITDLDKSMNFLLNENIIEDGIILGRKQNKGRIIKNINFDKIFSTKKYNNDDNMPILSSLKEMMSDYVINSNLLIPNGFRKVIDMDLSTIFAIMRGTRHRASIFNPYTYGWLLQNYFEGERVIAPTAGWNSYQLGFHQTDWKEFTCIDVIESVIDNSKVMDDYFKNKPALWPDDKIVNAYCCPSEKIELSEKNYYDLCLFSPPYYNLEVYETDNPNQSFASYPQYDDWLNGYWNETVLNISKTIKKGGIFAFVISNYKNIFEDTKSENYQQLDISNDMLKIAERHLKYDKTEQIAWGAFSKLNGKMASGNLEDMHILQRY